MSIQFNSQKPLLQAIQFSQTVLIQTFLIQTIQFSISIDFVQTVRCQNSSISNILVYHKYSFNDENSSISNNSVQHKYAYSM